MNNTQTDTRSRTRTKPRLQSIASRKQLLGVARLRAERSWGQFKTQRVITGFGIAVVAMTALSLLAAVFGRIAEAWVLSCVGLALIICALPWLVGKRSLAVDLQLSRDRVTVGDEATVSVLIKNTGLAPALPADAEIQVGAAIQSTKLPILLPGAKRRVEYAIDTAKRGVYTIGPFAVVRRDPLEIFRRETNWEASYECYVWPYVARMPEHTAGLVQDLEGQTSRRIVSNDIAFHAVREYEYGDEQRHIDWKATAKTGRPMVRQYEQTETARAAILLDVIPESYGDDSASEYRFETAVSAAASFAMQAVLEGRERCVASGFPLPGKPPKHNGLQELAAHTPKQLLDNLSRVQEFREAPRLPELVRALLDGQPNLTRAVIVTGDRLPLDQLKQTVAQLNTVADVTVVRTTALNVPLTTRSIWGARVCTIAAPADVAGLLLKRGVN